MTSCHRAVVCTCSSAAAMKHTFTLEHTRGESDREILLPCLILKSLFKQPAWNCEYNNLVILPLISLRFSTNSFPPSEHFSHAHMYLQDQENSKSRSFLNSLPWFIESGFLMIKEIRLMQKADWNLSAKWFPCHTGINRHQWVPVKEEEKKKKPEHPSLHTWVWKCLEEMYCIHDLHSRKLNWEHPPTKTERGAFSFTQPFPPNKQVNAGVHGRNLDCVEEPFLVSCVCFFFSPLSMVVIWTQGTFLSLCFQILMQRYVSFSGLTQLGRDTNLFKAKSLTKGF